MAAAGDIDPMHQFVIEPIVGSFQRNNPFVFTNSALWTLIVLGTITVFMVGGMKRQLVPGRWQVAVEGLIGFVDPREVLHHHGSGPQVQVAHLRVAHLTLGKTDGAATGAQLSVGICRPQLVDHGGPGERHRVSRTVGRKAPAVEHDQRRRGRGKLRGARRQRHQPAASRI